jgi:hypothetical protein
VEILTKVIPVDTLTKTYIMKKIFILSLLLLRAFCSTAQVIQTPLAGDYCTLQSVFFTYTTLPPTGTHYEWMYEDYTAGWSLAGPNNVLYLGAQPSIQVFTGSIGTVCMVRLLTIDDLSGQIINSDGRSIASSKPSTNIPYRFHTENSSCGALEVPPLLDPWGGSPQRWAMWYKNGQATGISSYYYTDPADSAWYEYKVRLNCGDTMTTGLFYFPRPSAPILTAQGPTTFCTGDSVVLTASSSATIDNWYLNGVAIAGSTGKSSLKVGTTGQYTMRSKSSAGSGTFCYLYSNPISVTQNPGAYISGLSQACNGDSIQLTCTAASSYQWKRNGANIAGGNTQSIWVKQSGNYTVNTTGISCNNSQAKTVTIYLNPSSLSVTPGTAQTLCTGSTVTLTAGGNNISTYQWLRNGTAMPGATTATSTFTSTGNYKCVVANAIGCTKTTATVNVSSNPNPTLPQKTIVLQPGSTGIDSYTTSDFGNFSTNYGNASTIEVSNWYKYFRTAERGYLNFDLSALPEGTPIISANLRLYVDTTNKLNVNANLPNVLYFRRNTQAWNEQTISWNTAPDSTVFQQTVVPCSTITSKSYFTANIAPLVRHWMSNPSEKFGMLLQLEEFNQLTWIRILSSDHPTAAYRPKLTISYYYADITPSGILHLCSGNGVTFTTNTGPYTYQWFRNGSPIAGATTSSYSTATAGDYFVRLTAANGCSVKSLTKTVTVNAIPPINLTPSSDSASYCSGTTTVTLKADSLSGYSFQWKRNNVNIGGAIFSSFTPNASGWYKVITTSNCGITNTDSIHVTKVNNPSAAITAGGPTTFCQGQSVVLTSNTYAGMTLKWYRGTTYLSNINPYTASIAGNYYVVQTASGCVDTSNTISVVINCREGDFTSQNIDMSVFPVPAADIINITLDGKENFDDIRYELIDLSGKLLVAQQARGITTELNTSVYSSGIYLIKAFQGNTLLAAKRIIISH